MLEVYEAVTRRGTDTPTFDTNQCVKYLVHYPHFSGKIELQPTKLTIPREDELKPFSRPYLLVIPKPKV